MKKLNTAVLCLIIANVIWGAASPIFKFALQNVPPFSLAFLRFLFACLLLYPFLHKQLDWKDLKNKWLVWMSVLGISINIGFFFLALQKTESINAPIIASSAPIFILIGSMVFLKERVQLHSIAGVILSFLGILLIIIQPLLQHSADGEIIGNLLLIISTLGTVGHTLIARKIMTPKNALPFTYWSFFIGMISFLPFMLLEFTRHPTWMATLDYRGIIGIVFGAIFSSSIAYICYNYALSKLPAFEVGVFTYMDPIVSVAIAIPLLGEKITLPFILGSFLAFVGILVAEKRIHYHPIHYLVKKNSL